MYIYMRYTRLAVGALQTNCYIVYDGDGSCVVIDPGAQAADILGAIETGTCVRAVLLTHVHFDHIGAAREICEKTDAPLFVHEGDEQALSDPRRNLAALFMPGECLQLAADRLLQDGEKVTAGNMVFDVLHTPGHTPGCCCYLCGAFLFTGDTLFADGAGRTDFPGGDLRALGASLKRLAALEGDYTVLPGHGPETTLEWERQHNALMGNDAYEFDY